MAHCGGGGEEEEENHQDLPDESDQYEYFWKARSPFSQWHPSEFVVDGKTYNCAEQYMMYHKAVLMKDDDRAEVIMALDNPQEMKALGREIANIDERLWSEKCQEVVEAGNMAKFSQNEDLKEKLFSTYPKTLVEASPCDTIWGIGLSRKDKRAWNKQTWRGQNLLGETLTKVRDKLMESFLEPVNPDETMDSKNKEPKPVHVNTDETNNSEKEEREVNE